MILTTKDDKQAHDVSRRLFSQAIMDDDDADVRLFCMRRTFNTPIAEKHKSTRVLSAKAPLKM